MSFSAVKDTQKTQEMDGTLFLGISWTHPHCFIFSFIYQFLVSMRLTKLAGVYQFSSAISVSCCIASYRTNKGFGKILSCYTQNAYDHQNSVKPISQLRFNYDTTTIYDYDKK